MFRRTALALILLWSAGAAAHAGLIADVERLTQAIDEAPTAALYLARASKLRQLERYSDALADVQRAESRGAPAVDLAYERGLTLAAEGRTREALTQLDRFLVLGGRSVEAHRVRARQLETLKRAAEARVDLERAFELNPDPDTCLELARFLARNGWPADARATLERGLVQLSGAVTVRHELIALLRDTDPDAALAQARAAMALQAVKAEWRIVAAEILLAQRRKPAARAELNAARDELDALLAKRPNGLHQQARDRVAALLEGGVR